jgi:hypothetical protein
VKAIPQYAIAQLGSSRAASLNERRFVVIKTVNKPQSLVEVLPGIRELVVTL